MEKNSVTPRARSRGSGWPDPARPLPAAPRSQYYTGDIVKGLLLGLLHKNSGGNY